MTIKPILAPNQKRVPVSDVEKKDGHTVGQVVVVEQPNQQNVGVRAPVSHSSHRSGDGHGQSPQHRAEIFDEISRHRRSPHKSSRNKRRDHHDHPHLKRERSERVLDKLNSGAAASKCSSPRPHTVSATAVVGNNCNNSTGINKAPDQLGVPPGVLGCQSPKSQNAVSQAAINIKSVEDTYSGYNSGDEHLQPKEALITVDEWQQRDEQFAKCMTENGYVLKTVEEDGACLFRAISLQIYGDEEMHDVIRQHTMDYISKNREYFSHFVTEDINNYIKRKRRKDSHGNHIEIQAMSEIYSRPVEVYCYKPTPINIFNSEQLNNGYAPLRLSYQRGSHYNAIIDPYNATVGVGLGLAGYKPEMQTTEAARLSEQVEIEQTMFEDKLKTTDWEATNEAIEEQIARESYLQWCRENLQKTRSSAAATSSSATSTSATVTSAEAATHAEASPSKYALQCGGDLSCNTTISTASTCQAQFSAGFTAESLSSVSECTTMLPMIGPAKPLSFNLKKDSHDAGHESDDTDMSSTSSIGNSGNSSPTTAVGRAKKSKNRDEYLRHVKKRRREINITAAKVVMSVSNKDALNLGKPTKQDNLQQKNSIDVKESRPCSIEIEQQPSTSKQLQSPEKKYKDTSLVQPQLSSLYQELLEASYTADGFEQLTESEMLQRAIQMSTRDYIENQKRNFFFGPSH